MACSCVTAVRPLVDKRLSTLPLAGPQWRQVIATSCLRGHIFQPSLHVLCCCSKSAPALLCRVWPLQGTQQCHYPKCLLQGGL